MRTSLRAVSTLLAAIAAEACTTQSTYVLVMVDTDAPSRVEFMRAQVTAGSVPNGGGTASWSGMDIHFPGSFSVTPGASPDDAQVTLLLSVTLSATTPGQPSSVVDRVARFQFVPHTPSVIRLFISASCADTVSAPWTCSDGAMPCTVSHFCELQNPPETCGDEGQCIGLDVVPSMLLPDGAAPPSDAMLTDVADTTARADTAIDMGTDVQHPTDANDTSSHDAVDVSGNDVIDASDAPSSDGCASGGACTVASGCASGLYSCATGTPLCAVSTMTPVGTACAGGVCDGMGSCVPCMMGATCSTGNPCETGSIACGTGAPVCQNAGNVGAGTACAGGVCDGSGTCVACSAGASCATGNPCTSGSIACSSGAPMCNATNVSAGTTCPGGVCSGGGSCGACTPGAACTLSMGCENGTVSCTSGMPVCNATTHVAAGTACPGGVCNGSGGCVACTAGSACSTGNPCTTGAIVCSSGAPVCTATGSVAAGASCPGGVCNGSGTCNACTPGMSCSAGQCVATAAIVCSSGAAVCTPETYVAMGAACSGIDDGSQCDGSGHCVCLGGGGCTRCGVCHFSCTGVCP